MFESIGRLREYWHVIALSREIKPARQLKRTIYGHPLLIWRDKAQRLFAIDDCCAHRRAPLEVKDYQKNRVVCPYHGWTYESDGSLVEIPSDPNAVQKLKCQIPSYEVQEAHGFVWVHLKSCGRDAKARFAPAALANLADYSAWQPQFLTREFTTSEELLIDNFMDPTHTSLVHDGLIRNSDAAQAHRVTVATHEHGVLVNYDEQEERVGLGARLLFGRSMRTQHSDEFLLPNLVRVAYEINQRPRFVALIACTPLDALGGGRTLALIQLRYDFGVLTKLARPFVARLASKVLQQDAHITAAQFANSRAFAERREHMVAADTVATRVTKLRRLMIEGKDSAPSSQEIELQF